MMNGNTSPEEKKQEVDGEKLPEETSVGENHRYIKILQTFPIVKVENKYLIHLIMIDQSVIKVGHSYIMGHSNKTFCCSKKLLAFLRLMIAFHAANAP